MSRVRDIANILSGGSSAIATDAEITSAVSNQFVAGKNKIINSDFGVWQRGTSFSTTASLTYTADRWWTNAFSGTVTVSQQTFTAGTAPVAGYEGQFFLRFASTNTFTQLGQRIEDVRVFAGQTVTVSFWAKAASALSLTPYLEQYFGSGGSASTYISGTSASVTTSWQRFTATISVSSVSGKTIGTSSFLNFYLLTGTLNTNIDIWGVQIEAGSVATAFQTATGTIQSELAACQRYYYRQNGFGGVNNALAYQGVAATTTTALIQIPLLTEMRVSPTAIDQSNLGFYTYRTGSNLAGTATLEVAMPKAVIIRVTTAASLTINDAGILNQQSAGTAFLGLSAEL